MSKQAKGILVKQFKDQINALLSELDEQKQMLAEDDDTIATLRQALARWEHGDQAGAVEVQARIKDEHDARELNRQLKHLESHVMLREKQMLDLKDELSRLQQQRDSAAASASASPTAASGKRAEAELATAQQRIAALEREVSELTHRAHAAEAQRTRRESVVDSAAASERALLTHKVAQLEAAMAMHRRVMDSQQREVDDAKAAAALATAARSPTPTPSPLPTPAGPTPREQTLEAALATAQAEKAALEEGVRAKDEEVRLVKEKAKDKLNTASDAVKKMKAEYANLRAAYTKLRQDSTTHQADTHSRLRAKFSAMQAAVQLARSEAADIRVQMQAMSVSLVPAFRPLISRHFASLHDHFKAETASLTVAYRKEQMARKALFNTIQELKGNIRVYCRVRPLSHRETDSENSAISFPDSGQLTIVNPEKKSTNTFEFEQVFDEKSTQESVFAEVSDLVTSVLDGYNVCIFAYGQTGSGKTFTMAGPKDNPGVNIRALDRLFVVAGEREVDTEYNIKISLLEIYNEKIHDLLSPQGTVPLKAVQGPHGMTVQDLTYVSVRTKDEVLEALDKGSKNRKVSSTNMNADSSRSHLILSVYVLGRSRFALTSGASKEVMGKLHLIDLAGSERISRSGVTGDGLKEAQAINSSLSALGNCIAARANKNAHVPYRDSALTYLLQDSLEKNSKTLMFVQVSPNASDASESICSLRFAERVRKVELGKASANVKKT